MTASISTPFSASAPGGRWPVRCSSCPEFRWSTSAATSGTGSFSVGSTSCVLRGRSCAEAMPITGRSRTSDPALFCVLRRSGAEMSVGVINFSATSREAVLTLPEDFPAGEVRDLLAARTVRRNGQRLSVRLKPWDTALYAVAEPLPEPSSPASPPSAGPAGSARRTGPDRRCEQPLHAVDRIGAGGALEHFAASGGETLLGRSDLLFSKPPENASGGGIRRTEEERRNLHSGPSESRRNGPEHPLCLRAGKGAGGEFAARRNLRMRYRRCFWPRPRRSAIRSVPWRGCWMISSRRWSRFPSRLPAVPELYHRGYRNRRQNLLLGIGLLPAGSGRAGDPLLSRVRPRGGDPDSFPRTERRRSRLRCWRCREFASTPVCALYHSLPGRQAERFQFELRPLAGTEPAPAGFGRVEQGGVSLRSGDGGNWVVENDMLRIVLIPDRRHDPRGGFEEGRSNPAPRSGGAFTELGFHPEKSAPDHL